jgi:hypothetical protein
MIFDKAKCRKLAGAQLKELKLREFYSLLSNWCNDNKHHTLSQRMCSEVKKFSHEEGLLLKGYWLYTSHVGNSKGFAETVARAALKNYAS